MLFGVTSLLRNSTPSSRSSRRRSRRAVTPPAVERLERREVLTSNFTDAVISVAVHTSAEGVDSVFVCGMYRESVDVDPGAGETWMAPTRTDSGGNYGRYLGRYTQDGQLVWAQPIEFAVSHLVVQGDALYASNGRDITKYDLDGTVVWNAVSTRVGGLAVDADGSVYTVGTSGGTMDLNPAQPGTAVYSDGGNQEVYLAKWDPNGAFLWYRRIDGENSKWVNDVRVKDGVVYVAGRFFGTLDADDASSTNPVLTDQKIDSASTRVDGFVAQFTTAGAFVTVSQFIDAETNSLAIGAGEVYVGGSHDYATDLNPGAAQYIIPTPLNAAGFIVRLARNAGDGTLSFISAKSFGTTTSAGVGSLALQGDTLYAGGQFFGVSNRTNFGTVNGQAQTLLPLGTWDAYLMSVPATDVTNSGLNWVRQIGTATYPLSNAEEVVFDLAAGSGGVYAVGSLMAGTGTFGGFTLPNGGDGDGFVTRVSATGQPQWLFGVGSVVRTIDNGTPGYSDAGGWTNSNVGFNGTSRQHKRGTGSGVATWSFTGLPNGTHEIQARWPANSKNASNAPYTINGGAAILVNQRLSSGWYVLGTVTISNGTITVRLTDAANGNVIADAVRVAFLAPPAQSSLSAAFSTGQSSGAETQTGTATGDTSNVASLIDTSTPSKKRSTDLDDGAQASTADSPKPARRQDASQDDLFANTAALEELLN